QQGLWIVKSEERYEPTFSYRWDLLEAWLPEAVAEGRRIPRAAALDAVVARYANAAVFTRLPILRRLFAVPAPEAAASITRLVKRGVLVERDVPGLPGRWLVITRRGEAVDR
ncbi:MAG TPA: hypothetical protein VMR23_14155, partial [Candidatus Limnocylindria bacterium]|nr:hypothetical protein [Candidatus Limnocylindria bacterium]